MQIFKNKTNFDFMGKRRFFAGLSVVLVVLSIAVTVFWQPRFGIDFAGGTEIQVRFPHGSVSVGEIRNVLLDLGIDGAEVVSFGDTDAEYLLRIQSVTTVDESRIADYREAMANALGEVTFSTFEFSPGGDKLTVHVDEEMPIAQMEEAARDAGLVVSSLKMVDDMEASDDDRASRKCESATCTLPFKDKQIYEISLAGVTDQVMDALRQQSWGEGAERLRSEWVGAKVGKQLRDAGIASIGFAILFIMIYIAFRFDLRYAPGAAVALLHDIIITMGILTVARVEVTLATVAALLTIVGYSLNDTIVVFDRIRENMNVTREVKFSTVINTSLNQTLSRTILTSVTTLLAVMILLVFGWKTTLRDFSFALVVGVLVGTYSSIYVASPVLAVVDRLFDKKKA